MTRRLRPPIPIHGYANRQGEPTRICYGGRLRQVTHIAARWGQAGQWWVQWGLAPDPLVVHERSCYRVVLDGTIVVEVFRVGTAWYLERVID